MRLPPHAGDHSPAQPPSTPQRGASTWIVGNCLLTLHRQRRIASPVKRDAGRGMGWAEMGASMDDTASARRVFSPSARKCRRPAANERDGDAIPDARASLAVTMQSELSTKHTNHTKRIRCWRLGTAEHAHWKVRLSLGIRIESSPSDFRVIRVFRGKSF